MSKLKKVPNYILFFLVFLLSFTRATFARIFPSARSAQKPDAKVFALSPQTWAALRVGAEWDGQNAPTANAEKKDEQKPAEDKKDAEAKDSAKTEDKKDNAKSEPEKDKAPEQQSPGGGEGDAGGIGG